MGNIYYIQLFGVLLTAAGLAALTACAYAFGKPLPGEEKSKRGHDGHNTRRLPLNLATIASTAFVLSGLGILTWSNFNLCSYLAYWLPGFTGAIRFWLACTS